MRDSGNKEHRLVNVGHSTWDGYWWGGCACGWKTPPYGKHNQGYWGPLSREDVERYFAKHVEGRPPHG
jgi:hypothetical protein